MSRFSDNELQKGCWKGLYILVLLSLNSWSLNTSKYFNSIIILSCWQNRLSYSPWKLPAPTETSNTGCLRATYLMTPNEKHLSLFLSDFGILNHSSFCTHPKFNKAECRKNMRKKKIWLIILHLEAVAIKILKYSFLSLKIFSPILLILTLSHILMNMSLYIWWLTCSIVLYFRACQTRERWSH